MDFVQIVSAYNRFSETDTFFSLVWLHKKIIGNIRKVVIFNFFGLTNSLATEKMKVDLRSMYLTLFIHKQNLLKPFHNK